MPITFRLATKKETVVVEVLCDGEVCACICPAKDVASISIVSANMELISIDDGRNNRPPIPAVVIALKPEPYVIHHGSIIRSRR
jgi:hypothetical protein